MHPILEDAVKIDDSQLNIKKGDIVKVLEQNIIPEDNYATINNQLLIVNDIYYKKSDRSIIYECCYYEFNFLFYEYEIKKLTLEECDKALQDYIMRYNHRLILRD